MFSAAHSGITVTFVIIDGPVVTVASVGDSRCILESAEGTVYFLSADHRLDANEEEYVHTSALSFIPHNILRHMINIRLITVGWSV
jgi:serine/threonine protein phosphatase PrpC